jgi:hypothetical protein
MNYSLRIKPAGMARAYEINGTNARNLISEREGEEIKRVHTPSLILYLQWYLQICKKKCLLLAGLRHQRTSSVHTNPRLSPLGGKKVRNAPAMEPHSPNWHRPCSFK